MMRWWELIGVHPDSLLVAADFAEESGEAVVAAALRRGEVFPPSGLLFVSDHGGDHGDGNTCGYGDGDGAGASGYGDGYGGGAGYGNGAALADGIYGIGGGGDGGGGGYGGGGGGYGGGYAGIGGGYAGIGGYGGCGDGFGDGRGYGDGDGDGAGRGYSYGNDEISSITGGIPLDELQAGKAYLFMATFGWMWIGRFVRRDGIYGAIIAEPTNLCRTGGVPWDALCRGVGRNRATYRRFPDTIPGVGMPLLYAQPHGEWVGEIPGSSRSGVDDQ